MRTEADRLPDAVVTLAERLKTAGYATAAFTDGGFVAARYGFDQGFDHYADERVKRGPNGFRRSMPEALAWIASQGEAPFFLFLHSFDPHASYTNTDPEVLARFRERPAPASASDHWLATTRYLYLLRKMGVNRYGRLSQLLNDYDAGVHVADRGVGALLDHLARVGRLDDALVIVTSDHGESFLDHGPFVGHGLGLTDDELAIPLLVKLPGNEAAGMRSPAPVDLLDIVPTVLDIAGLPEDAALDGASLASVARGNIRERSQRFGESTNTGSFSWVEGDYKYITATRLDALEIAQTHLGPLTPPPLAAEAPGSPYAMAGIGRGVELRYDRSGDPLGMADRQTAARLYRRSTDPGERRNLAASERRRAREMRARLSEKVTAAMAGRGTAEAVPSRPDVDRDTRAELEALGYLAPGGASGAADSLPDDREATAAPEMQTLIEQDRIVHEIRLRGHAGTNLTAVDAERLAVAERVYAAWSKTHPKHAQRAVWRLRELAIVAASFGVPAP